MQTEAEAIAALRAPLSRVSAGQLWDRIHDAVDLIGFDVSIVRTHEIVDDVVTMRPRLRASGSFDIGRAVSLTSERMRMNAGEFMRGAIDDGHFRPDDAILEGGRRSFEGLSFYREVMAPLGLEHQLRVQVVEDGVPVAWVGGYRRGRTGSFKGEDMARGRRLVKPIVEAGLALHRLESRATPAEPADFVVRPDGSIELASRHGQLWLAVPGFRDAIVELIAGRPHALAVQARCTCTPLEAPGLTRYLITCRPVQVSPQLREALKLRATIEGLTPKQREVARHAAEGLSLPDIAEVLAMSPETAKTHLRAAYQRLGVESRAELARLFAAAER